MDQYLRDYLHDTKDDWNYITPADFYNQYFGKKHYLLIDLRDKASFDKGPAKNIYWLDILDKPLPKDKKIFLICYVGHTSSQVLVLLKLLGYDVTDPSRTFRWRPGFPTVSSPKKQRRRTHKRKM